MQMLEVTKQDGSINMQVVNALKSDGYYIGLSQGTGKVSKKIMEITKGEYSHALAVIQGTVYQAHFGTGVHSLCLSDYEAGEAKKQSKITFFEVSSLNKTIADYLVEIKAPYDNTDIREHYEKNRLGHFNWIRDFNHSQSDKLICTEFVDWVADKRISYALSYAYSGEINPHEMFETCEALMGDGYVLNKIELNKPN